MKDLYEISPAHGAGEGVFEVRLNPGHDIFRGHFPGNPVLPGICSLMLVRDCASRLAARPLRYASVRESKFLAAITPDAHPTVRIKLTAADPETDARTLDATIQSGDVTMLKLKARLTPDE